MLIIKSTFLWMDAVIIGKVVGKDDDERTLIENTD